MGLFRYFSKEASAERKRASAQKRLSNMYYQSAERMAAAQEMAELAQQGDNEALQVLLQRFEPMNPSPTIDRDEKEYVVQLLDGIGDFAIEGTKKYVQETSEAIFWPMRFLQNILGEEDFTTFLGEVLAETPEEYVRDPKKKLGLVQLAGEFHNESIRKDILRFVQDYDESVRFHAINIALNICGEEAREVLLQQWLNPTEESGRIHRQLADAFVEKGWDIAGHEETLRDRLPPSISLSADGKLVRR